MKTQNRAAKRLGLATGLLLALAPLGAQAAVTPAGTDVTNSVTLDFQVNSTAQTQQTADATFKVDKKATLTVTPQDTSEVTTNTQPGSTTAATEYSVKNEGNGDVKAFLKAIGEATGATDTNSGTSDLDMSSTTVGVYTDSDCQASHVYSPQTLAAGTSQTVYVCVTIPSTATNGQIGVAGLQAKVGNTSDTNAPTADDSGTDKNSNLNTELFIFADSTTTHPLTGDGNTANDGTVTTTGGGYKVQAANLSITKTVKVLEDPTCNGTGCKPHAIPGATMEYTLKVENTGASVQTATDVDIKDTLDTHTTYAASSTTVNTSSCGDSSGTVTNIGASNSTATCNNSATSTPNVKVTGFSVGAGETVTITYKATVD